MGVAIQKEKPLAAFVQAIEEAGQGRKSTFSIRDALRLTNLVSSKQDGWVIEDRMFGGPPQGIITGIPQAIYEHFVLNLRGVALSKAEKRVRTRQSSRIEEEAMKPLIAVFVVHQIRDEALCVSGKTRINNMNRDRPDLVSEVLDDIRALNGVFPTVGDLENYKRQLIMNASELQASP